MLDWTLILFIVHRKKSSLQSSQHRLCFTRAPFTGPKTKYQSRSLLELNPLQKPCLLNYSINIIPFHLKCSQRCHFQPNERGNPSCTEGDCSDFGVAPIPPSTFTSFLLSPAQMYLQKHKHSPLCSSP